MKTPALLSCCTLVAATACAQPVPRELAPEDVTAIEESTAAFAEAVRAADWDGVAALYTEDVMLMPPNEEAREGRAAAREWLGSFPPLVRFELDPVEIEGVGDLAYVRGTYALEMSMGDRAVTDRGKYVEIRREQEDGSWLIAVDIFNSDQPAAPPPAADSMPADSM